MLIRRSLTLSPMCGCLRIDICTRWLRACMNRILRRSSLITRCPISMYSSTLDRRFMGNFGLFLKQKENSLNFNYFPVLENTWSKKRTRICRWPGPSSVECEYNLISHWLDGWTGGRVLCNPSPFIIWNNNNTHCWLLFVISSHPLQLTRQILDKVSKTIIVLVFLYWLFQKYHVMDYLAQYFNVGEAATTITTEAWNNDKFN